MAIRKLSEGLSGWNSKTPFPRDAYTLTCVEETFAPSKGSGNPMLTRTWEVVSPETVVIGDKNVNVGGVKILQYRTVKVKNTNEEAEKTGEIWNQEKSDKAFGAFSDELLAVGFDPANEIDDENPPIFMLGKTVVALCYGKEDVARKPATREQLAKGQKVGDKILDAYDKEIKTYQPQLETILSLAPTQVGVAY